MNLMEARILAELRTIVGDRGLISSPEELHTYECDGLTNFRVLPRAVLLPNSTEQVQAILRVCHREKIPFVARGSGTGLRDRKSTRLNSSHLVISYAVFCLKKKKTRESKALK